MYDKKNIEKMATETPKRSLDNQEFIAWKEDVMPSSSTQPPRKVIKLELVAMKTHAGDFEHIHSLSFISNALNFQPVSNLRF